MAAPGTQISRFGSKHCNKEKVQSAFVTLMHITLYNRGRDTRQAALFILF